MVVSSQLQKKRRIVQVSTIRVNCLDNSAHVTLKYNWITGENQISIPSHGYGNAQGLVITYKIIHCVPPKGRETIAPRFG